MWMGRQQLTTATASRGRHMANLFYCVVFRAFTYLPTIQVLAAASDPSFTAVSRLYLILILIVASASSPQWSFSADPHKAREGRCSRRRPYPPRSTPPSRPAPIPPPPPCSPPLGFCSAALGSVRRPRRAEVVVVVAAPAIADGLGEAAQLSRHVLVVVLYFAVVMLTLTPDDLAD